MKKKLKYRLKLNDSVMSEIATIPLEISSENIDMINPISPEPITDLVNPTNELEFSASKDFDAEVSLNLSTKLQTLISFLADELYSLLEESRDEGDYIRSKEITNQMDLVYSHLSFVNSNNVSQIDQSIITLLQLAKDNNIKISKKLEHSSIYPEVELEEKPMWEIRDAMDYESKEGSFDTGITNEEKYKLTQKYRQEFISQFKELTFDEKLESVISLLKPLGEKSLGINKFVKDLSNYKLFGVKQHEIEIILDATYKNIITAEPRRV